MTMDNNNVFKNGLGFHQCHIADTTARVSEEHQDSKVTFCALDAYTESLEVYCENYVSKAQLHLFNCFSC